MDGGKAHRGVWLPNTLHARAIINFIHWSQGGLVLDAALKGIVEAFGAECGVISRLWLNKGAHRVAARADTRDPTVSRPLFLSFANDALGPFRNMPKRASVFSLREDGEDPSDLSPVLVDWLSHRKIKDILFVCLDHQGGEIDFLELHFGQTPEPGFKEAIEQIAPQLSETYQSRRPGLVTEALSRQTVSTIRKSTTDTPILSTGNPAGLTRAEWRVCALVSRGISPQGIGTELGIGPATVRTHLKHIYSKTGLDNFHMLARRLVSVEEREALHGKQHQARA
ncbi:response regulator [Ruegeria sp. THAF57]|uniref:helix-turn-helix transcriptional regulator n=1 Tax=Ruegeria sp. THAF57 TaxID=2744555 RepID=UPI0015DD9011|nr:helix-turn-helix transcriptional regulator [Ruegeria sp. THAF57]CAD0185915.1 response regulator [Ruegeria sp. THAF57]